MESFGGNMNIAKIVTLGTLALAVFPSICTLAEETQGQYVRVAQIEIDPTQLENYNAAAREEIEASVRLEPGVLALYAVAEKDNPAHIIVFEMYRDLEAYRAHLETPHFKKYKTTTKDMVRSLNLVETSPIALCAKAK